MKASRLVVGLTGGIGSGKSAALAQFARLGAATVSLDAIARKQAEPGGPAYKRIVRDFGPCILKRDGTIDRALLGRVVFSDKKARLGLEKATHPLILKEMKRLVGKKKGIVVVDVPLLFEKKLQKNFDATIVISCKPAVQLRRIMKRDGWDAPEARRRIAAQLPLAKKVVMADVTVQNNNDVKHLAAKVREYYLGLELIHRGSTHGNADQAHA